MQSQPLASRLKKRAHRDVAYAQDLLVAQAYDSFPDCVLHGGTAIWRCYAGGRFSEDVDAYLPAYSEAAESAFRKGTAAKGMKELKFRRTASTVFAKFELGGAEVSFEAALRNAPARVVVPYETLGGGRMLVAALPPESLAVEKARAYLARGKVRDLYDLFFLLARVGPGPEVTDAVGDLINGYRPPADEAQLKTTILTGVVPSAQEMIEGIRRWGGGST